MNRQKIMVKNTLIFGIGNFGSKILAYIMVVIYTHYIGKEDLGYYDLVLTTISLIQPIVMMAFDEGAYRWLVGNENIEKRSVISTSLKATGFTSLCSIAVLYLLNIHFHFRDVTLIALFSLTSFAYQMILNAVRGLTNNKLYAGSGILNSILLLIFEVVGIVFLSMGIEALLISKILANIMTIIYIYIREPTFHGISRVHFDRSLAKSLFNYSMPLVPNQLSWWIVNSSDRYIIVGFLGTAFNGIYTISNKFPTIITTITGIIYFALQETIIKEYSSEDRDKFYSSTFKNYYVLLFALVCCAIPATKLIINWFVSTEYIDAWMYTGFLYLSTVFSALSSFLGIGYQISKETKRSVLSTISAAGVNILINIVFIKAIGLHAASFSTFVSYAVLFIIRIIHSKRYFVLHVNWTHFGAMTLATTLIGVISYIGNIGVNIGLTIIASLFLLLMNRSIIKTILNKKGI